MRTFVAALLGLAICASGVFAEEVKGKVKSMDTSKATMTITTQDGQDHIIQITGDSKITTNGKPVTGGLKSIKEGDTVSVSFTEEKEGMKVAQEIHLKRVKD